LEAHADNVEMVGAVVVAAVGATVVDVAPWVACAPESETEGTPGLPVVINAVTKAAAITASPTLTSAEDDGLLLPWGGTAEGAFSAGSGGAIVEVVCSVHLVPPQ
jgi:hypothetical protein